MVRIHFTEATNSTASRSFPSPIPCDSSRRVPNRGLRRKRQRLSLRVILSPIVRGYNTNAFQTTKSTSWASPCGSTVPNLRRVPTATRPPHALAPSPYRPTSTLAHCEDSNPVPTTDRLTGVCRSDQGVIIQSFGRLSAKPEGITAQAGYQRVFVKGRTSGRTFARAIEIHEHSRDERISS